MMDFNKTYGIDSTYKPILVCKLTSEEQHKRSEELRAVIFRKIAKTIEHKDRYEFIFNESVDFSLQLTEYINFERKCCPGFTYSLLFKPEEGAIHLTIGNSKEIKELVKVVLSEFKDKG